MPLGAFRINTLSRFVAAGGGISAGDSLTSLTGVVYNTDQYYTYRVNFAGVDSSGKPVFAFGFRDDTANAAKALLIRIEDDNSITAGSITTFYTGTGSLDPLEDVQMITDNGDSAHCVMTYQDRANSPYELYARAASLDLDTLSFTLGTQLTVFTGSIDTMTLGAYLGNGRYVVGHRSSQIPLYLLHRAGTTLTLENSTTLGLGTQVYNTAQGYDRSGNLYRMSIVNSTATVNFSAKYWNGTTPSSNPTPITPITGLSSVIITQFCALDSVSKGLVVSTDGTTTKAAVTDISWPGSGTAAPTLSSGTQLTLTDDVHDRKMLLAKGEDNTAHLIYYDNSASAWKERTLTASGTTLTEGASSNVTTLTSSQTNFGDMAYYNDGTWKYLLAVVDNSGSNTPDCYVKRF